MEKAHRFIGALSLGLILVTALLVPASFLRLWDCGACRNVPPLSCPYCNSTGKQDLFDRLKYARGVRGGPWLQNQ